MKIKYTLRVNGKTHTVNADPGTPLLYVLRNNLSLNGPKYGCGMQQCGACMVLVDGNAEPSCMMPVESIKSRSITTLEGLVQPNGDLHPVQEAFLNEQAAQCGYCLNGMIMSTVSLLAKNPNPDDRSIREGLQKVLCRCGTQARIIRAAKRAVKKA